MKVEGDVLAVGRPRRVVDARALRNSGDRHVSPGLWRQDLRQRHQRHPEIGAHLARRPEVGVQPGARELELLANEIRERRVRRRPEQLEHPRLARAKRKHWGGRVGYDFPYPIARLPVGALGVVVGRGPDRRHPPRGAHRAAEEWVATRLRSPTGSSRPREVLEAPYHDRRRPASRRPWRAVREQAEVGPGPRPDSGRPPPAPRFLCRHCHFPFHPRPRSPGFPHYLPLITPSRS